MSGSLAYYLGGYISSRIIEFDDDIHMHPSQLIEIQKAGILELYESINIKSYKVLVDDLLSQFPDSLKKGEVFPLLSSSDFNILQVMIDKKRTSIKSDTTLAAGFLAGLFEVYYGVYNSELLQMANKKTIFKRIFREPTEPQVWISQHHTGNFDETKPEKILEKNEHLLKDLKMFIGENPPISVNKKPSNFINENDRSSNNIEGAAKNALKLISDQAQHHSTVLQQNYQTAVGGFEKKSQEFQDNFEAHSNQVAKNVESKTQEAIENALAGVKAEGILRQAFKLWEDKESTHRTNFNYGVLAFCGLIVLSAFSLWLGWSAVKTAVGDAANASVAKDSVTIATAQLLSHIVLISLPFATVLWILRAILRWANLNLSLAEDAAQRSVLAQTYVNLLANGHIEQDKDREIMLSALFRPLPGLKNIDIPPMSIREYVDPTGKPK